MLIAGRISWSLLLAACLVFLAACGESGYLFQSVKGHMKLMSRAEPIDDILASNDKPDAVIHQLETVVKLRAFAADSLHLPDNGSYHDYADLERPYAVWNLTAAPEFSLKPMQWCFPVVGCVSYRGYFDEKSAHLMAEELAASGFDVDVYGVEAYSTLNWFDDPVLNTFLKNDEIHLAALLFHEMAHQVIYVPNATTFNESFAKTVEREGLRRWFLNNEAQELWLECLQREKKAAEFQAFLNAIRTELQTVYLADLTIDEKRQAKNQIIARSYESYAHLQEEWGGFSGYDQWMGKGINNARLASVAAYHDLVPAFQALLKSVDYDLPTFYAEVRKLGALSKDKRQVKLLALSPRLNTYLH
jgi:predicted aminopeptidase